MQAIEKRCSQQSQEDGLFGSTSVLGRPAAEPEHLDEDSEAEQHELLATVGSISTVDAAGDMEGAGILQDAAVNGSFSKKFIDMAIAYRASMPNFMPYRPEYVVQDPPFECGVNYQKLRKSFDYTVLDTSWTVWSIAFGWMCAEFGTWATTGESFFGTLTGGVVESIREVQGLSIRWHMATGAIFWGLCFIQIFLKWLRKGELAWIHRRCGQAALIFWFLVVGPTAAYLSLYCSPGPHGKQLAMAGFSFISLDTTLYASYFLWRGWLVALRRKRGADSLTLHGKAMRIGVVISMSILWQRPVQLAVICVRKLLLLMVPYLPHAVASTVFGIATHVLDHHVILSVTTVFPYAFASMFMLDGPRSIWVIKMMDLNNADCEELFGSLQPCLLENALWRCHVPFFIGLRWYVTSGWTVDPLPQA